MGAKLETTEKIRERNYVQVSLSSRKIEDRHVRERRKPFKLWWFFFKFLTFPFVVPGPLMGPPEPCWWQSPAKPDRWLRPPFGSGCPLMTEGAGMGSIVKGFLLADLGYSEEKMPSTNLTLACEVKRVSSWALARRTWGPATAPCSWCPGVIDSGAHVSSVFRLVRGPR